MKQSQWEMGKVHRACDMRQFLVVTPDPQDNAASRTGKDIWMCPFLSFIPSSLLPYLKLFIEHLLLYSGTMLGSEG